MFEFRSYKCPVCGKEFFPAGEWAYKDYRTLYCSWGCLRVVEKQKEKKGRGTPVKKVVEMLTIDGVVEREFSHAAWAAAYIGGNDECIREACRSGKLYKGYMWRYRNGMS